MLLAFQTLLYDQDAYKQVLIYDVIIGEQTDKRTHTQRILLFSYIPIITFTIS